MWNYIKLGAVALIGILASLFIHERASRKEAERDLEDAEGEIKGLNAKVEVANEVSDIKEEGAQNEADILTKDNNGRTGVGGDISL